MTSAMENMAKWVEAGMPPGALNHHLRADLREVVLLAQAAADQSVIEQDGEDKYIVEARAIVADADAAMLVAGMMHSGLTRLVQEPMVSFAPMRKGRSVNATLSIAVAPEATRVYRDGMVVGS